MSADVLFGQNVACVCVLSVLFAYTATQYHQDRRMRLLLVAMLLELGSAALLMAGRTYSQFGSSVVQVPAMTLCARVLCVGSTVVLATSFVLRRRDGRPDVAWGPLVATLAPAWTAGLWAAATRDEPPLSLCATVSVLLAFAVHFRAYEAELKRRAEAVDRMRSVALQEQMRPHFTFNAIAALRELCKTDPDKAAEGLDNLAGYLRANIDAISQTATVPFAQELSHVEQYVALEHLNPNSRFEIVYDLQVLDFHVPVLSVQPLVENAILHGVRSMGEDGMVILSTERHGNLIRITVEDNGPGVQDGATNRQMDHAGRGMENVRSRLESLCGGSLNVRSDGNGTRVSLIVPQKGGHDGNPQR